MRKIDWKAVRVAGLWAGAVLAWAASLLVVGTIFGGMGLLLFCMSAAVLAVFVMIYRQTADENRRALSRTTED